MTLFPTQTRSSFKAKQNEEPKISQEEKTEKLIKGIYLKILTMTKFEGGATRSSLQHKFSLGDGQFERIMPRVFEVHKDAHFDRRTIPRLYKTNPLMTQHLEIEDQASHAVDLIPIARRINKSREVILA